MTLASVAFQLAEKLVLRCHRVQVSRAVHASEATGTGLPGDSYLTKDKSVRGKDMQHANVKNDVEQESE